VRLAGVLDLREAEARRAVDLSDRQLRADDPGPCQEIGEAAHYVGLEGILAPSAAGPGTVLAIFLEKLQPGSLLETLSSETWETPPPERS